MSPKLRILLVDDHNLFRKGLATLFVDREDMEIVEVAKDGQQAIELTRLLSPDLILMDVHMPRLDGIQATKIIKQEMPDVKIIMLSASDSDDDLFASVKNGANGYLLKNIDPTQLFSWLTRVRQGEVPMSGVLADRILQEFRSEQVHTEQSGEISEALTTKETEILELLVGGESNKQIADILHVSENTVKFHLRNIMDKLHLRNRLQIAVYAVRQGLVSNPPNA
ncbi:MAG: response regulator transcription factor [Chloroflexi bacterium]|nr:response regulator transcription factor [Chloroflexota bacterium]